MRSEAFSVDNGRSRLVVLFLGDPHLLEGGERGQDGSSDPDGVRRTKCSHLLVQSLTNSVEHGSFSRKNDVSVQFLSDIDIALYDRFVGELVNSLLFQSNEGRLGQNLWEMVMMVY